MSKQNYKCCCKIKTTNAEFEMILLSQKVEFNCYNFDFYKTNAHMGIYINEKTEVLL